MNSKLLILALGLGLCHSASVKQNLQENKNLAQTETGFGASHFFGEIPRFTCDPNTLPPPLCPPPPPTDGCPPLPGTTLPETGVLVGFGTEIATEAFAEEIILEDTACCETTNVEVDSTGTNCFSACSCSCGLRKYCVSGTIDYTRDTQQHELGEIRSTSAAEACITITANAGFLGGELEQECPGDVECPCLEIEVPPGIFPPDEPAPVVVCTPPEIDDC